MIKGDLYIRDIIANLSQEDIENIKLEIIKNVKKSKDEFSLEDSYKYNNINLFIEKFKEKIIKPYGKLNKTYIIHYGAPNNALFNNPKPYMLFYLDQTINFNNFNGNNQELIRFANLLLNYDDANEQAVEQNNENNENNNNEPANILQPMFPPSQVHKKYWLHNLKVNSENYQANKYVILHYYIVNLNWSTIFSSPLRLEQLIAKQYAENLNNSSNRMDDFREIPKVVTDNEYFKLFLGKYLQLAFYNEEITFTYPYLTITKKIVKKQGMLISEIVSRYYYIKDKQYLVSEHYISKNQHYSKCKNYEYKNDLYFINEQPESDSDSDSNQDLDSSEFTESYSSPDLSMSTDSEKQETHLTIKSKNILHDCKKFVYKYDLNYNKIKTFEYTCMCGI